MKNNGADQMIEITESQFKSIGKDYSGVWSSTNRPELIGKRTAFKNCILALAGLPLENDGTTLFIETFNFVIIEEK